MNPFRPSLVVAAVTILALTAAPAVAQQVGAYTCTEDGVMSFSDRPCGEGERRFAIDYDSPTAPESAYAAQRAAAAGAPLDSEEARLALKREIARAEGQVSDLKQERDQALAQLHATLHKQGADDPPSLWNQGINGQIKLAEERYRDELISAEARLEELRREDAALEAAQP